MVLTSTVEALSVGSSDPAVNLGPNDGSVNLISFKGLNVIMSIGNSFAYNYYVDEQAVPGTQVVQSDAVTFYVAANPAIGSSIAVDATLHTVTFPVHHNGAPNFNLVLLVITQDSSIAEGSDGTYVLALFSTPSGFEVGTTYTNTISGGAAHTLTVSGITGTDYATVTSFTFQSASALTTADANVVAYVSNAIEGADSFAVSVTPIIPPLIERAANGITIQYTGTAGAIPSSEPLFLEANPRGTGLEWFAVINNSSKSMLMDYASNLSSGLGRTYFTKDGYTVDFKNIVTTLMTDMSSLFENKTSFNEDISSWDTSNVLTMSSMFRNARAFNINIGGWNVGKVKNMSRMFETDPADPWSQFNNGGSGDIGNWNTSEVTTMSRMFTSAKSFNQSIVGWNVIKVADWSSIFANAQTFAAYILTKAPPKFR
jgi:surface protein